MNTYVEILTDGILFEETEVIFTLVDFLKAYTLIANKIKLI